MNNPGMRHREFLRGGHVCPTDAGVAIARPIQIIVQVVESQSFHGSNTLENDCCSIHNIYHISAVARKGEGEL